MLRRHYVGLISAVPFEASLIKKYFIKRKTVSRYITEGLIGSNRIVHMTSGIGIANASHAATVVINKYSPVAVVNFGIGGAYPGSGLKKGDVALAEKEIYADAGVLMKDGLHDIKSIGIPLLQKGRKAYYNEFPANNHLLGIFKKNLPDIPAGVFLTVSQSTGTIKRARELRNKYNASCENMEGAAVAHICTLYGVPFIELRGISNMVENRDIKKWDTAPASVNCQRVLLEILNALYGLPEEER